MTIYLSNESLQAISAVQTIIHHTLITISTCTLSPSESRALLAQLSVSELPHDSIDSFLGSQDFSGCSTNQWSL